MSVAPVTSARVADQDTVEVVNELMVDAIGVVLGVGMAVTISGTDEYFFDITNGFCVSVDVKAIRSCREEGALLDTKDPERDFAVDIQECNCCLHNSNYAHPLYYRPFQGGPSLVVLLCLTMYKGTTA